MPKSFHKMRLVICALIGAWGGSLELQIAQKNFHQALGSSTAIKSQRG